MRKIYQFIFFLLLLNGLLPSFAVVSYQVTSCNTSGISLGKYIFMLKEQQPLLTLSKVRNLPDKNWQL